MAVATVAAPVAPVAPVLAQKSPTATQKNYCQGKYNEFVDWTSRNTSCGWVQRACGIRVEGTEGNPADSTMMKVERVALMILTSIVTVPIAALVATFYWIKDNVCGKAAASTEQPNAPPVVKADVVAVPAPVVAAAPAPAPVVAAAPAPVVAAAPAPVVAAEPAAAPVALVRILPNAPIDAQAPVVINANQNPAAPDADLLD